MPVTTMHHPRTPHVTRRSFLALAGGLAASGLVGAAGCRSSSTGPLRLGHFPNVTHAAALVGAHTGRFEKALGSTRLEILTFNAQNALQVGFSKGTASTLEELTKAMGYAELQWVGEDVKGSLYPISKAEKWNIAYRKQAKNDEDRLQEYWAKYQMNVQAAASEQTREGRARFVGRARAALEQIKAMIRNNPNFIMFALNMNDEEEYKKWMDEQEKRLRDLMR